VARRAAVLALAIAGPGIAGLACGHRSDAPAPGSAAAPAPAGSAAPNAPAGSAAPGCQQLPFAASTPVPEASGAAWIDVDGKPALLVVGDSGNHGAYGIVDPETGETGETGRLPLSDAVSDDIEGVSARGDRIAGLTSSGWVLTWRRHPGGFDLIEPPYPLGPVDAPQAMACRGRRINCGRNYEGLCLAPAPRPGSPGGCVGFAASKADGALYCLTEEAGALVAHADRAIRVVGHEALSDCAFGDDGTLWAGSNLFDLSRVYRIARWDDPAAAQVERIGSLPVGFPEVIAVRGDVVYRMSDMGGSPSLMARFRCPR
jgi:hypothetical protein